MALLDAPSDPRLSAFLAQTDWAGHKITALAGDASSRRYMRVRGGPSPAMIMDCGPAGEALVARVLEVAAALSKIGLRVPKAFAHQGGLLLQEDLGDALFARVIEDRPDLEATLYAALVPILARLNAARAPGVPVYSAGTLAEMISPAYSSYRAAVTGDPGAPEPLQAALHAALSDLPGQSLSLRDFHAENLFWLPEATGINRVGLIDTQDAMMGPSGYDLASLLMDARRRVDPAVTETVLAQFGAATARPLDDLRRAVAVLGAQRNLRILGIFVRLAVEQGKPHYLDFLPRVWGYVEDCLEHPALREASAHVRAELPAATPEVLERLKALCKTGPPPS